MCVACIYKRKTKNVFIMAQTRQQLNMFVQISYKIAKQIKINCLNSTGTLLTLMFNGHGRLL